MKKIFALILTLSLVSSTVFMVPSFASEAYTDTSGWTITTESIMGEFNDITKAIDGDINTYWHSKYYVEDGKVVGHDNPPYEIIIEFPEALEISGVRYVPRQKNNVDSTAGIWKEVEIYASTDKSEFKLLRTVSYDVVKSRATVDSAIEKGSYKAMKFVVTDADNGYCTAAEIIMLKGDVKDSEVAAKEEKAEKEETTSPSISAVNGVGDAVQGDDGTYLTGKGAWSVMVSSSKVKSEGYICRPIDGDYVNYWHSDYKNEGSTIVSRELPPHNIDITFPEIRELSGVEFTTRADGTAGNPTRYEIYATTDDSENWIFLEEGVADEDNGKKMKVFAANIKAKRIRYSILDGVGGYGSCAEIDFYVPSPNKKTVTPSEYAEIYDEIAVYEIPKENMTATANPPEFWLNHDAKGVLDETMVGFWQTATGAKGPFVLTIDLGGEWSIDSFDVSPRQSEDFHGNWDLFNVWVSLDGENYELALENHSFERSTKVKNVKFDAPVKARYVEFEIVEGYTNKASCAELTFYQSGKDYKEDSANSYEKYVLKIGSPVIEVTRGAETKEVTLDVAPFIDEGYTLIPLRGLLEEMGASISWEGKNQSITVENNTQKIEFQIWNNLVYVTGGRYGRVRYTLNQEPRIVDSRTFIPLRFVSEHLGYTVEWDGATQTITITKE